MIRQTENIVFSGDIIKGTTEIEKANTINQWTPLLAKAAAKLESMMVVSSEQVVRRDLDTEYKEKSDTVTITVKVPTVASEHSDSGDDAVVYTEQKRDVKMDYHFQTTVSFTANELTQALSSGRFEVLDSMIDGMVDHLEEYMMDVFYKGSIGYAGEAGATMSDYTDIIEIRTIANKQKMPGRNRTLIVNPDAAGALLGLDQWKNFSASGTTAGLIAADLGSRAGFDIKESSFVPTHTGAFEALNVTDTVTIVVASNSTMTDGTPYSSAVITESGASSILTITKDAIGYLTDDLGVKRYFTVLETTAAAISGVVTAKITAMPTACTTTVLVFADKNKTSSVRNLAIQKDCVALVARPLAPFPDIPSVTFNVGTGIPMRLSYQTAQGTSKTNMKLECLCKAIVLRGEGVTTRIG